MDVEKQEGPGNEAEKNDPTFALAAVEDSRDTIRAIDQKVNFLLIGLAFPFSCLSKIVQVVQEFWRLDLGAIGSLIQVVLVVAFPGTWVAAFYFSLKALGSVGNPASHVNNDNGASGIFFSGGLYKFDLRDLFVRRKAGTSRPSLLKNLLSLRLSKADQLKELAFEHMKLVFIRDLKMYRQTAVYRYFFYWVLSGGLIWTLTILIPKG